MLGVLGQFPPRKIVPPAPKPTLTQTQTGCQFSSGAIVWLPPTLKLTLTSTQTLILTEGNAGYLCWDPIDWFIKSFRLH